jgi:hypothetical protein
MPSRAAAEKGAGRRGIGKNGMKFARHRRR